jgi:hypothetical protein
VTDPTYPVPITEIRIIDTAQRTGVSEYIVPFDRKNNGSGSIPDVPEADNADCFIEKVL